MTLLAMIFLLRQLDEAEAAIKEIMNDTPLPDPRALSKQVGPLAAHADAGIHFARARDRVCWVASVFSLVAQPRCTSD